MQINIKHIKDKDLFELEAIEPRLKTHLLLNRKVLNDLRILIERALCDTVAKKKRDEK